MPTALEERPFTTPPPNPDTSVRRLRPPPASLRCRVVVPVRAWLRRPFLLRFRPLQLVVLALAAIVPLVIAGSVGLALLGVLSIDALVAVALGAGENPGIIVFGAMFLATPVQRLTGLSQVRVRKCLGIVFFLLALSNGAMFVLDAGLARILSAPFLIAGTVAVALSLPLFLTSSRRVQRAMGIRRWRLLHKLTYVVAAALLAHVVLIGDIGPGAVLITLGFICRAPSIRRVLERRATRRRNASRLPVLLEM